MGKTYGAAVRPLVAMRFKRYHPIGSSVLLQIGHTLFLLSAGHVFQEGPLFAAVRTSLVRPMGEICLSHPSAEDPRADIAIVRLNGEASKGFPNIPRLTLADIEDRQSTNYIVVGYPASRTQLLPAERRARYNGLLLTAVPARDVGLHAALKTDDRFHLLLHHDPDDASDINGHRAPRLKGTSGGAVFGVTHIFDETGEDARLAAIAIEWHAAERVIVATRIAVFIAAIRKHWPDVFHTD